MRIAYLSRSTLRSDTANSIHVMQMCSAFGVNGHDVTLYGLLGQGDDDEVFEYYGLPVNFRLQRYQPFGSAFGRGAVSGLPGWGGTSALLEGFLQVRRDLRATPPDLAYCRSLHWALATPRSIPMVFELHGPPSVRRQGAFRALLRRRSLIRLVVISHALRAALEERFPEVAGRIAVAHDAAHDPGEQAVDRQAGDQFTVGYVGHLYEGRGIEVILRVAAQLPTVAFHMVGGRREDVQRISGSREIPSNVTFFGHQPPHRLNQFFANFDAVVAPYQERVAVAGGGGDTAKFMSPLKVFEYMSWQKPIVCSDLPVLRETLEHGRNALLVSPADVSGWVRALEILRSDRALAARLSAAARSDFTSHYTWSARAEKVLQGLTVVGDEQPPTPP